MENEIKETFTKKRDEINNLKRKLNDNYAQTLLRLMNECMDKTETLYTTEEYKDLHEDFTLSTRMTDFDFKMIITTNTPDNNMFTNKYFDVDYVSERVKKYGVTITVEYFEESKKFRCATLMYDNLYEKEQEKRR